MLATTALVSFLVLATTAGAGSGPQPEPIATTTTLQVEQHGQDSSVLVRVDAAEGVAPRSGTVTLLDGDSVLAQVPVHDGYAELTTNLPRDGGHVLTADFAAQGRFGRSRSGRCPVGTPAAPVRGNVTVTIPGGMLTITSATEQVPPHDRTTDARRGPAPGGDGTTASGPARVVVTDTRAGNLGFSVRVTVTTGRAVPWTARQGRGTAELCEIRAAQLPGNALDPADVRVPRGCLDAGRGTSVATYPAGIGLGTLDLRARVVVAGELAGAARLTWTVM